MKNGKNLLTILFAIMWGMSSMPLSGMAEPTQEIKDNIKKSFIALDGMDQIDSLNLESFKEIANTAQNEKKQFFLAVIPLEKNQFHFFDAPGLANVFITNNKIESPLTRQIIDKIFLYRYNPQSADKEFPFDFVKTINQEQIKDEFTRIYKTIDLIGLTKKEIERLESLPQAQQTEEIRNQINIKRLELIKFLNPESKKDYGEHSAEIFKLYHEIAHDTIIWEVISPAKMQLVIMLMHGWGQPNNQPNYPEAIKLCNEIVSEALQIKDRDLFNKKYESLDFARFNLAEMARMGLGQPNKKPDFKEAARLYNEIIRLQWFDAYYFKSKLALANMANNNNIKLKNKKTAEMLYREILKEAQEQQQKGNPVDATIIAQATDALWKLSKQLQSIQGIRQQMLKPQATPEVPELDVD